MENEINRLKTEYESEIAKLQAEIEQKNSEIQRKDAELERKDAELEQKDLLIKHYEEQLRIAQHRMFGTSSERTEIPEQLGLFNEPEVFADEDAEAVTETETEGVKPRASKRKRRKGKRGEFYENIPVREEVHELPEEDRICPICGRPMRECGREVVRCELEHIPASVTKVEHVQVIYDCADCDRNPEVEKRAIVKSVVPAPVIPNSGIASPSLLAYIICCKYVLSLPLHRQAEEFRRLGIEIPKQNMANWVIFVSNNWFLPMWLMLLAELKLNEIIHIDESTLQVINELGRTAAQKSYMWGYCTGRDSPRQVVLFDYQETREKTHPLKLLEGFGGKAHVDAYSGYHALELQGVTLSYCWSHARRKFVDALKTIPKEEQMSFPAYVGLRYCDQLFFLEKYYDEEKLTREQRERWRELLSIPLAEEFFAWAKSMLPKTRKNSLLQKAVYYAVHNKDRLMNAFLDGRLEISNNRAERNFKHYAVGRANWKFAYSPKGAQASAVAYSMVETAQENGLVPYLYIKFLLETLPNLPKERYHECLPWNQNVKALCSIPKPADKPMT